MFVTGSLSFPGNAAPAHPCARGIRASLHSIDVRGWQPPASTQAPELDVAEAV